MPTAIRGLRRPMIPTIAATTTRVMIMPAPSAALSFSPKVRIAKSLSHSGVISIKA